MSEELSEIGRAKPVFLIGDSHTQIFDGRIYQLADQAGIIAVSRDYIPGITAQSVSTPDGSVSSEIVRALKRFDLITESGVAKYTLLDKEEVLKAMAHGGAQTPPFCIFHIGEINVRQQLARSLGADFDIVLPPGLTPYKYPAAAEGRQISPFRVFSQIIETIFEGLFRGLAQFKRAGLTRLFLHSMPVPYSGDEVFEKQNGFALDIARRIKVSLAVNAFLARKCKEHGIGFIDIWGDIVDETGKLQPKFELDGFHLGADACLVTVKRFLDCVRNSQIHVTNGPRYGAARDRAEAPARGEAGPIPGEGYAVLNFAGLQALPIGDLIPIGEKRFTDIDWAYRPDGAETGAEWFAPSLTFVERLAALLFEENALLDSLAAMAGGRPVFYSARPFRPRAGEMALDDWARDAWPIGLMRAIAVIDAADGEEFRLSVGGWNAAEKKTTLSCPPGSLIVYDPRQVRLTIEDGSRGLAIDMHFGPAVPEMSLQVVWNGANCWPGDPFIFSLREAVAAPTPERPYLALLAVPYWEDQPAALWHQTVGTDAV